MKIELYPERGAEDGRQLPRLREERPLRRHAVPPRDRRLHDPGRRLHHRLQAEADQGADPDRIGVVEQGRAVERRRAPLAMARTGDPNSATSQFFINVADNGASTSARRRGGLRLHGVRPGDRRHGRREQIQGCRRDRPPLCRPASIPRTCPARKSSSRAPRSLAAARMDMVLLKTNHGDVKLDLDAETPRDSREFPPIRARRALRQHGVPSSHRRLHDPGRRHGARHEAETHAARRSANEAAQRPQEQEVHGGDGAYVRTAFGDRAVLHHVADNDFLDYKAPSANGWGYCVFGKVVDGQDVVDRIRGVATGNSGGHQNVPNEDVVITEGRTKSRARLTEMGSAARPCSCRTCICRRIGRQRCARSTPSPQVRPAARRRCTCWATSSTGGSATIRSACRSSPKSCARCAHRRRGRPALHRARQPRLPDRRAFAKATGASLLPEQLVLDLHGVPTVLMRGDELCTSDTEYQAYRARMRDPAVQARLLRLPYFVRRLIAAFLRWRSRDHEGAQTRVDPGRHARRR